MPLRAWKDALYERRQPQRKQQVASGVGWGTIQVRDRHNDGLILEVGTEHTFEGAGAVERCWHFKNSFSREDGAKPHPLRGDIYLREELADGTWLDERALNSGVQVTGVEGVGIVGARVGYRLTIPRLVTGYEGFSGGYSWLLDSDGERITDSDFCWIGDSDHET
jgi:hypothetical protein